MRAQLGLLFFNAISSFNLFWNTKVLSKWNFNDVYSKNNLFKINDGKYVIYPDEFKFNLYLNDSNIIYFDDFGVQHIPKEIKKFIDKHLS